MESTQDIFISHAGRDKERYVQPLAEALAQKSVTFWLDNIEIAWGDSVASKINEGLANSRFVLLCLSQAFLRRPWPEAEMAAAFALQNDSGVKRVLPLILDSKEAVLAKLPLVAGLAYREFSVGVTAVADEISTLCGRHIRPEEESHVVVESVHTGKLCNISVSRRVSVKWLADQAKAGMGVSDLADTGAYEPFHVRWVLVDTRAEETWRDLPRFRQRHLRAIVSGEKGLVFSESDSDRLGDLGVADGTVFHIYAIEDEDRYPPPACGLPD